MCLQDDDSDFLCPFASDLYGSIPKGKCGGTFYFVVFICSKKEKKNQKQKEGIKFLKEKKIEKKEKKMSEREIPKIELWYCF